MTAPGIGRLAGWTVLVGVVLGSALTVAYTARFLWGAFATKPGVRAHPAAAGSRPGSWPRRSCWPCSRCVLVASWAAPETTLLAPYADQFPSVPTTPTSPCGTGSDLALAALAWSRLAARAAHVLAAAGLRGRPVRRCPPRWSAERRLLGLVRRVDRAAVEVTGLTQRGSVATYLSVILVVVVLLPARRMLAARRRPRRPGRLGQRRRSRWSAAIIVVAAVLTTRSRRRLKAVVLVGVTGYGTAMLFLLHGAPDLALTQVLVETVTLVVFVLVLRRLPEYFTDRPLTPRRYWRMALGAVVAALVAGVMLVDHRCPHAHTGLGGRSPRRRWRSAAAATSST